MTQLLRFGPSAHAYTAMFVCHGLLNSILDGQVTMPAADLNTVEAAQASLSTPAGAANLIAQINETNAAMGTSLVLPDVASITGPSHPCSPMYMFPHVSPVFPPFRPIHRMFRHVPSHTLHVPSCSVPYLADSVMFRPIPCRFCDVPSHTSHVPSCSVPYLACSIMFLHPPCPLNSVGAYPGDACDIVSNTNTVECPCHGVRWSASQNHCLGCLWAATRSKSRCCKGPAVFGALS